MLIDELDINDVIDSTFQTEFEISSSLDFSDEDLKLLHVDKEDDWDDDFPANQGDIPEEDDNDFPENQEDPPEPDIVPEEPIVPVKVNKAEIARAIFKEHYGKLARKDIIKMFIAQANLTPAGAATYYQKETAKLTS